MLLASHSTDVVHAADAASTNAISKHIQEAQSRIKSLHVIYDVAYRQDGQMLHVEREIALMFPHWMRHRGTKELSANRWYLGVIEQQAFLDGFRGTNINAYPMNRLYFRRPWNPNEGLPGSLQYEMFFTATGIWPTTAIKPPRPFGHAHVLSDIAASDEFTVESQAVNVGGIRCHLIRHIDGLDHIWIAPEFGYNVVKRELIDKQNEMNIQFVCGDFNELAPGVWLPRSIKRRKSPSEGSFDARERLVEPELDIRVSTARVNDLGASEFMFTAPPGALRINHDNVTAEPLESTPGSVEYMDALSRWISEYEAATQTGPSFPAIQYKALIAGMIMGLVSLTYLVKRRACNDRRSEPSRVHGTELGSVGP